MSLKVLVVDDSGFFRRRVADIINADSRMEVIGVAENGLQAVDMNKLLKPDVITMDYEMPEMDGITAIRHIMADKPIPVLMFSSLSFEGARVTFDALDAGAVDFLPKNFDAIAQNSSDIRRLLTDKIVAVARSRVGKPALTSPVIQKRSVKLENTQLVVIGTSTGGPAALQTIFKSMPASFQVPIVIVQHMPASFTKAFAERLDTLSALSIKEAEHGDVLKPGCVYVAPGGMQLMFDRRQGKTIHIHESDSRINYRPSVDVAFASAAKHYGSNVLGLVLTGMGTDGREGARLIKEVGGHIWAQNEESSVIFGMPMAVIKEGLADVVLSIKDVCERLTKDI